MTHVYRDNDGLQRNRQPGHNAFLCTIVTTRHPAVTDNVRKIPYYKLTSRAAAQKSQAPMDPYGRRGDGSNDVAIQSAKGFASPHRIDIIPSIGIRNSDKSPI